MNLRADGMIIEYFRMNGDSSYNDQMARKMKVYKEAGIDGIYLMESHTAWALADADY